MPPRQYELPQMHDADITIPQPHPDPKDPSALTHAELVHRKRQWSSGPGGKVSIPGCVTGCMAAANTGLCASNFDYLCLCSSEVYQKAVMQCWAVRCNATSYDLALSYSTAACTALGSTINPGTNGASSNLTMAPVIFSRTAFNIQAVMSTLCSVVLIGALALGIMSCRSQARKQALISGTSHAWTGAATGVPTNKSRVSRVPRSYFPGREVGQISTVDLDGSVDFSEMFQVTPRPVRPRREPRFTNRLPNSNHNEGFTNHLSAGEGWELTEVHSSESAEASGSGSGSSSQAGKDEYGSSSAIINKDHESGKSVRFSLGSKDHADFMAESIAGNASEVRHGETHNSTRPLNPNGSGSIGAPATPSTVCMGTGPNFGSTVSLDTPPGSSSLQSHTHSAHSHGHGYGYRDPAPPPFFCPPPAPTTPSTPRSPRTPRAFVSTRDSPSS